jgi:hypothetical protein
MKTLAIRLNKFNRIDVIKDLTTCDQPVADEYGRINYRDLLKLWREGAEIACKPEEITRIFLAIQHQLETNTMGDKYQLIYRETNKSTALLHRVIRAGGFMEYIKQLEAKNELE